MQQPKVDVPLAELVLKRSGIAAAVTRDGTGFLSVRVAEDLAAASKISGESEEGRRDCAAKGRGNDELDGGSEGEVVSKLMALAAARLGQGWIVEGVV